MAEAAVVMEHLTRHRRVGSERRKATTHGGRWRRRILFSVDLIALVAACSIVGLLTAILQDAPASRGLLAAAALAAVLLPLWAAFAMVSGLYRREEQRVNLTVADDVFPVVVILSLALWAMMCVATVVGADMPGGLLVQLWAASVALVFTGRVASRAASRRRPGYVQNTLIVGAGDIGQLLGRKLSQHPELGLKLLGFVDDEPKTMRKDLSGIPVLGAPEDLAGLVREYDVHRIVVAFSNEPHYRQLELVHTLRSLDVHVDLVPRLFEAIGPAVDVHYIEGLPLVSLPTARGSELGRATKRAIDVVGSSLALVFLSPLIVYIAWGIKRDSDGPILFRQQRLGENMEPFEVLKFRTMRVGTDAREHRDYVRTIMDTSQAPEEGNLYKLDRADSVTAFGSWLRRFSLDELPQLVNVLRGDMSLVGPRPCLDYELELFEPQHFDRFLVPAGMTGLWQVAARARTTFKEALDLDAAYARDWSLSLDLKLMVKTPVAVFRGRTTT